MDMLGKIIGVIAIIIIILFSLAVVGDLASPNGKAKLTDLNIYTNFQCSNSSIINTLPNYQTSKFKNGSIWTVFNNTPTTLLLPFAVENSSIPITLKSMRITTPDFILLSVQPTLPITATHGSNISIALKLEYTGSAYTGALTIEQNETC